RGLRQDIAHVVRLLDRHRRMVEMICWHLMASVIAVAVAFRAGLLALLRDVGIKPEVIGSRLVAAVTLSIVPPLPGAALLAVEPHGEAFVVKAKQLAFIADLGGRKDHLAGGWSLGPELDNRSRRRMVFCFGEVVAVTSGKGNAKEQRQDRNTAHEIFVLLKFS